MANIPTGWGQCNFIFTGAALPTGAQVTFGFQNATDLDAAVVATELENDWDDSIKELTPTTVVLDSVLVKLGPNDVGPSAQVSSGTAGTGGSGHVSPNVAVLIQKRTLLGGRRNRGRMFYPVSEGEIDNAGALSSSFLTFASTQWLEFLAAIEAESLPMAVLHTDPALTPVLVDTLAVQAVAATQRRRLRR
jgi:hypothetical protein